MIAIHRMGRAARSTKPGALGRILTLPPLVLRKCFAILFGINIPFSVRIGGGFFLPHFGCIFIHDDSVIGRQCSIYQGVTLGAKGSKEGGPILGDGVNVGAGAKILGSVRIGDRVDVGANAVVLRDVPDDSLAVGVPATVKPRPGTAGRRVFA
jgi:serine O-acetyltransferase